MSFWIYRKDKEGKSAVYSVNIPIELLIIIIGILAAFILPRYMFDSTQIGKDSLSIAGLGFVLFFISKISLFKKRIWNSWGPRLMSKPFKVAYSIGYVLIALGVFGSLLFYSLTSA
jgi:hypothetical protein